MVKSDGDRLFPLCLLSNMKKPPGDSTGGLVVFRWVNCMQINLILSQEEFEPVIIDLLKKSLNRELNPEQIKSVNLDFVEGRPKTLTAKIEIT